MSYRKLILSAAFLLQIIFTFCSDRYETPGDGDNSTQIYRSKSKNGIEASITFCEKISKETGAPIKPGTVFAPKENSKVYSIINLINRNFHNDKDLMFHIDWLDSTGNSIFKKRIDLLPADSSSTLISSINTSPERRQTGKYSLRVYLFRELIAEKKFELINRVEPVVVSNDESIKNLKVNITLCKGISKKDGRLIGSGNKFEIKDKAKVLALIKIENKDSISFPLVFHADWVGPNDSSFYRKKIEVASDTNSFTSSISISPDKRQPGQYRFQIFLFEKLIGEQNFTLTKLEKKEKTVQKKQSANFSARVVFCEKVSKKTGLPVNPDSVFMLKENGNLKAIIQIEKQDTSSKKTPSFLVEWMGMDNNLFYRKKIELTPDDSSSTITSSISISPQKRKPGDYILRVYYNKELISEKKFALIENSGK
jgi:hypothetical protein